MVASRALSSHSSSVSYSAANTAGTVKFSGDSWKCGADRMVKIELEAAEALAGLAHSAMYETESETPGGELGRNEGEPVGQQVQNESSAGDSGFNPEDSVPMSSDLAEDQAVVIQQHREKICSTMTKPVKVEWDAELKANPLCTTSYASSGGSKSRQNLTEAEKESRRLRRVLANRESARQTIRRRQALYEELTRKAADLTCENEKLKTFGLTTSRLVFVYHEDYGYLPTHMRKVFEHRRITTFTDTFFGDNSAEKEKDLAMKEYDSLKSINECLKAQMSKIAKTEVQETEEETKSTYVEIATTSSTSCPVFIYNQPSFLSILWPSIIQPSNSVQLQCGSQSGIAIPSQVPMPATGRSDSYYEQDNPIRTNSLGTPLYVLPCPWLFPIPHHSNGFHPQSSDLNDKQNGTSPDNQCSTSSSSKTVAHMYNHHSLLPMEVKTEASTSTSSIHANNLHENPFGFPPDGGGHHVGPHPRGMVVMPASLSCVGPAATVELENNIQREHIHDVKAISTADIATDLPGKNQEPVVCPSKQVVDVVAAAEARKRRKELTKLKNLHCRQFRVHH